MNRITISVIEDNAQLRRALSVYLNRSADMRFLSGYGSAEEALAHLPTERPEIVLMDICLPGMDGIQCLSELRKIMPQTRIIMLTAYEDSEQIFQSLAAGAYGYLLKSAGPNRIREAIREVHLGGSPISGSVARKMCDYFQKSPVNTQPVKEKGLLSNREAEVLELLAAGHPYKNIADFTQISLNTVRSHIKQIYEKLHVSCRTEATLKFYGHRPEEGGNR